MCNRYYCNEGFQLLVVNNVGKAFELVHPSLGYVIASKCIW